MHRLAEFREFYMNQFYATKNQFCCMWFNFYANIFSKIIMHYFSIWHAFPNQCNSWNWCWLFEFLPGLWGIPGRVVRVVDFKSLAAYRCGFESHHGLWILPCEKAIQLAYRMSAVLLRCQLAPEIMQGEAPEVFSH